VSFVLWGANVCNGSKADLSNATKATGGIIVDSEVQSEFEEVLLKSRFVRKLNGSFYLFETFLFDGRTCRDLDLHLQRLKTSAQDLGFEMKREEIQKAVFTKVQNLSGSHKVKIQLQYDGGFEVEIADLVPELASRPSPAKKPERDFSPRMNINDSPLFINGEKIPRVCLSAQKINSQSIFQKYKTSNREVYDDEWMRSQKHGFYDLIFLNERDEVAEASRHNIFIKANGQWKTPPLSSGALPGIARQRAIAELSAKEDVFFVEDLHSADEILLTNSVRGMVRVLWSDYDPGD
jgi:para-aminobenzoate synthetase/4-amino-4-deoxychorismate lyase